MTLRSRVLIIVLKYTFTSSTRVRPSTDTQRRLLVGGRKQILGELALRLRIGVELCLAVVYSVVDSDRSRLIPIRQNVNDGLVRGHHYGGVRDLTHQLRGQAAVQTARTLLGDYRVRRLQEALVLGALLAQSRSHHLCKLKRIIFINKIVYWENFVERANRGIIDF